MTRYGTGLEEQLLWDLLRLLIKDCSGYVAFREFLHQLQPPMLVRRLAVFNEALDKMDAVYKDDLLIWGNHMIAPVMRNYSKEHIMIVRFLDITKQDTNSKFAYRV